MLNNKKIIHYILILCIGIPSLAYAEPLDFPLASFSGYEHQVTPMFALSADGRILAELVSGGAEPSLRISAWKDSAWVERAVVKTRVNAESPPDHWQLLLSDAGDTAYLYGHSPDAPTAWLLDCPVASPRLSAKAFKNKSKSWRMVAASAAHILFLDGKPDLTKDAVVLMDTARFSRTSIEIDAQKAIQAAFSPDGLNLAIIYHSLWYDEGIVYSLRKKAPLAVLEMEKIVKGDIAKPRFYESDAFGFIHGGKVLRYSAAGKLLSADPCTVEYCEVWQGTLSGDGKRALVKINPPFGEAARGIVDLGPPARLVGILSPDVSGFADLPHGIGVDAVAETGDASALVAWPEGSLSGGGFALPYRLYYVAAMAAAAAALILIIGSIVAARRREAARPRKAEQSCPACQTGLRENGMVSQTCRLCGTLWIAPEEEFHARSIALYSWNAGLGTVALAGLVSAYAYWVNLIEDLEFAPSSMWIFLVGALGLAFLVVLVGNIIAATKTARETAESKRIRKLWASDPDARLSELFSGEDWDTILVALRWINKNRPKELADRLLGTKVDPASKAHLAKHFIKNLDAASLERFLDLPLAYHDADAILERIKPDQATVLRAARGPASGVSLAAVERVERPEDLADLARNAATEDARKKAAARLGEKEEAWRKRVGELAQGKKLGALEELWGQSLATEENLRRLSAPGENPCLIAIRSRNAVPLEFLFRKRAALFDVVDAEGRMPAALAAELGAPECVEVLLSLVPEQFAQADAKGRLPAHRAAAKTNREVLDLILRTLPETSSTKDRDGKTPEELYEKRVAEIEREKAEAEREAADKAARAAAEEARKEKELEERIAAIKTGDASTDFTQGLAMRAMASLFPGVPIDGAPKPSAPAAGTKTPGVIIYSFTGSLPDQSAALVAMNMFAMSSGNVHLMMGGIPILVGALSGVPDDEEIIVRDYRRTAAKEGWRDIRPTCQIIYHGGEATFGIAFPQAADFG